MERIYDQKSIRDLDRRLIEGGIPSGSLMKEAARCIFSEIVSLDMRKDNILILSGKGNNGGDGYALAELLSDSGYSVTVISAEDPVTDDAVYYRDRFMEGSHTIISPDDVPSDLSKYDIIIDCLFGVGFHGELKGIYEDLVRLANDSSAYRIACDVPSGVETDTGKASLAFRADLTVTFSYPKPCHFLYPGREYTGKLSVRPIADLPDDECHMFHVDGYALPKRKRDTHKGDYGRLLIVAGSKDLFGASYLCSSAALRSGAGLITLKSCSYVTGKMHTMLPEIMSKDVSSKKDFLSSPPLDAKGFDCMAIGPGLGTDEETGKAIEELISSDIPKVLDADALNIISRYSLPVGRNTVMTPHPGEFSRLSGLDVETIRKDPVKAARRYALEKGVVLLLKGATSVVTDGTDIFLITSGTPAMAKGGSGDVLTGVISSFIAQGLPLMEAAYAGAFLCGKAAEKAVKNTGEYSFTPRDTIRYLRYVL